MFSRLGLTRTGNLLPGGENDRMMITIDVYTNNTEGSIEWGLADSDKTMWLMKIQTLGCKGILQRLNHGDYLRTSELIFTVALRFRRFIEALTRRHLGTNDYYYGY